MSVTWIEIVFILLCVGFVLVAIAFAWDNIKHFNKED